jgi:hypothetical protein
VLAIKLDVLTACSNDMPPVYPVMPGNDFVYYKKTNVMSDDKSKTGKQDDIRVDSNDASEVEYLHQQFPGKSHEEIKKAIRERGPFRKDIEEFLKRS